MSRGILLESFESCVVIDNYLWFVTVRNNWLCKMNASDYRAELICEIPYADSECYAYKIAGAYDHYLLLMPEYANYLLEYDINSKKFQKYKLYNSEISGNAEGGASIKYRSSVCEGESIWLMPQSCHCILEYNYKRREVYEYTQWYKDFEKYGWSNENLFGLGVKAEKALWIPCYQLNAVLEFSLETKKSKLHFVGSQKNRFGAIAYCNNAFWLMDNVNQEIVKWNPLDGEEKCFHNFPKDYGLDKRFSCDDKNMQYSAICMLGIKNSILVLPCTSNQFMKFDTETGIMEKIIMKPSGGSYLFACELKNGKILCANQSGNQLAVYSIEENKMNIVPFYLEVDFEHLPASKIYDDAECVIEDYVRNIVNKHDRIEVMSHGKIGNKIYQTVND